MASFYSFNLLKNERDLSKDISFTSLKESIDFEDVCKGRKGAILVNPVNESIPIVRTTTNYATPVQQFTEKHYKLIKIIKNVIKASRDENESEFTIDFNNAMIEIYDSIYHKMGFHTDQSLDLQDDSYICLFSCYEKPPINPRKLKIQNKTTKECSEVVLNNNSIAVFSTKTNHHHIHKIVLDNYLKEPDNKWLGITFRLSKTFVNFIDGKPHFSGSKSNLAGKELRIASHSEKKEFYKHKSNENAQNGVYEYPEIDYTISQSDLMPNF